MAKILLFVQIWVFTRSKEMDNFFFLYILYHSVRNKCYSFVRSFNSKKICYIFVTCKLLTVIELKGMNI